VVPSGVVALRPPRWRDAGAWSRTRIADETHLRSWEPDAPGAWADRNSMPAWPGQCSALRRLAARGQALPFIITVDGVLAGQLTIGNVVRGALCSGWIGYWVAGARTGGGVASAAVALVADHCFAEAGIHRLEATVRPENRASIRVLEKNAFRQEGLYRRYLSVDGAWRDHLCFAVTAEEVADGMVRRLIAAGGASLG
jgi:ribosomal-protein-alanine N-acetyltransferase